ncbi:MAG TPA: ATP-binding protein [Opitutaceae bacterium]|nr:ATP-binding protein [Opitutaceae bacterium]
MRILHLEDSALDAELIQAVVHQQWPECIFERATTGAEFESALKQGGFDLVLSDYSIPDFDGLSALELARKYCPDKPFIFLSGTIGEERAVEALRRGAVDYVMKDRPTRLLPAMQHALDRAAEVSQRRAAEARIRQQASLLDKARDAICVVTLDRRVTFWNASAARLYGWTASEAIGGDLGQLFNLSDTSRLDEAFERLSHSGEWAGELRTRNRQGVTIVTESRWTLVTGSDQRAESVLIINTDVTDRKRLESQLMRAQRLESIGTLAGGIAHDLNNVLAPIMMAANVLTLQMRGEENAELLEAIETSARHGSELIRQLLMFARGADGQKTQIHLKAVMGDLEKLLRPSIGRAISLSVEFNDPISPIFADLTQFNQTIVNLCVNARDAMPSGGSLTIRIGNTFLTETTLLEKQGVRPGPFVRIDVIDTGSGIPPEIIDQIFDPFFTTKAPDRGTGLGLSNVLGILKGHGGFIDVDSTPKVGTTFSLYFPAVSTAFPAPTSHSR